MLLTTARKYRIALSSAACWLRYGDVKSASRLPYRDLDHCPPPTYSAAMIVRSFSRSSTRLRPSICRPSFRPTMRGSKPQCRPYSTPTPGPSSSGSSSAAVLAPFIGELDRIAPSFQINGSQIRVLKTPSEFYETLKDKIRHAEDRIFLSTLYIGKSEKELVRLSRRKQGPDTHMLKRATRLPPCRKRCVRSPG